MLFNKWINFSISTIGTLAGTVAALDLTSVASPQTAGTVASIAGLIRMMTAILAPAPSATVLPTGSAVVTHK